jgi:hypothetical protein
MQSLTEPEASSWEQIAPLLDDAMGRLGEQDRNAIVLRFFENRTPQEVAGSLKLNEVTARKRVSRALERLRKLFAKRGVVLTTAIIAGAISSNSVQAAPAALANSAAAIAIAKGATTSVSAAALAKATLVAMKVKAVVTSIAAATVVTSVGVSTYFVGASIFDWFHKPAAAAQASTTPADSLPIRFANDSFADPWTDPKARLLIGKNEYADQFLNEIDAKVLRTTNSFPAGHIECLVEPMFGGSADYLKTLTAPFAPGMVGARYVAHYVNSNSVLFGKRIRITGWMKAKDVNNWAGANLIIGSLTFGMFAMDMMADRPIHGTTDWQQIAFVTDVPKQPCIICFAPTLYGTGEIWCDDVQIDVVPDDTPLTDDRVWSAWSQDAYDYKVTKDEKVPHDGHPTTCVACVAPETPVRYAFYWWGRHDRDLRDFQKYIGHTIRMSAWVKTEGVARQCGLNFEPKDLKGQTLAKSSEKGKIQIFGTTDWTLRSITCAVPKGTEDFQHAFFIFGPGKMWVDIDSLKFEIVK